MLKQYNEQDAELMHKAMTRADDRLNIVNPFYKSLSQQLERGKLSEKQRFWFEKLLNEEIEKQLVVLRRQQTNK